jgi:hypothetical protein
VLWLVLWEPVRLRLAYRGTADAGPIFPAIPSNRGGYSPRSQGKLVSAPLFLATVPRSDGLLVQRCRCPATVSAVCRCGNRSSWVIDDDHVYDNDNHCKRSRDFRSRARVSRFLAILRVSWQAAGSNAKGLVICFSTGVKAVSLRQSLKHADFWLCWPLSDGAETS